MSYAVIIPSYNRPEMLKRSLASVYAQTVLPSKIHLVVDEPEDREKYAFLDRYDDALQVTYTGGGYGGAKARNVGLDQVDDVDYVFFLDDDDEWLPEKCEKQMALLKSRPAAMGVTCHYNRIQDGNVKPVMKGTEDVINRSIKIWNFIGGFSCYGMRWNSETQACRLNDSLASCQDFDYYIEVSKFGSVALFPEVFVNYYAHNAGRISDGRSKKGESFERILSIRESEFDFRECAYTAAKVHLFCAPHEESLRGRVSRLARGTFHLMLACHLPSVSFRIWRNALAAIVHRT